MVLAKLLTLNRMSSEIVAENFFEHFTLFK